MKDYFKNSLNHNFCKKLRQKRTKMETKKMKKLIEIGIIQTVFMFLTVLVMQVVMIEICSASEREEEMTFDVKRFSLKRFKKESKTLQKIAQKIPETVKDVETENVYQVWENDNWVNKEKETFEYNSNGDLTFAETFIMINDEWVNQYKVAVQYNVNGRPIDAFWEQWKDNEWINSRRITGSYDESGSVDEEVYFVWDENGWVNYSKYTMKYDSEGNMTEETILKWSGEKWGNSNQYVNSYNLDGNKTGYFHNKWDNGDWANYTKAVYTYDEYGNEIEKLRHKWAEGEWVNSYRNFSTYYTDGNFQEELHQLREENTWIDSELHSHQYDDRNNNTECLYQIKEGDNWINYDRYLYYYETIGVPTAVASGDVPETLSLHQNYPNPFNPQTSISFQLSKNGFVELAVYNVTGQKVRTLVSDYITTGNYSIVWDGKDDYGFQVSSGTYISSLRAGATAITRRMLLIK